MEHNPNGINETEFIEVLGNEDDFVQILGVTPPSDGNEIDVSSAGFDEGDSFLIDIDDISQIDEVEGWDSLAHVLIIGELETNLGISIPLDQAIEITTVEELFEKAGV